MDLRQLPISCEEIRVTDVDFFSVLDITVFICTSVGKTLSFKIPSFYSKARCDFVHPFQFIY